MQNVQFSFACPGAQPPVFIAGSFTDPPWQVQEMDHMLEKPKGVDPNSQPVGPHYRFIKNINVREGRWQYKFRFGPGDWWVCDEGTEIGGLENWQQALDKLLIMV